MDAGVVVVEDVEIVVGSRRQEQAGGHELLSV
jgi:hypothetical protein